MKALPQTLNMARCIETSRLRIYRPLAHTDESNTRSYVWPSMRNRAESTADTHKHHLIYAAHPMAYDPLCLRTRSAGIQFSVLSAQRLQSPQGSGGGASNRLGVRLGFPSHQAKLFNSTKRETLCRYFICNTLFFLAQL